MLKKGIVDSVLMKELISMRVDSGWSVLKRNLDTLPKIEIPGPNDEGATGYFDNKGALFIPGGLIIEDSDRQPIKITKFKENETADSFRERIREAMKYDNATLIYQNGFVPRVNLNNTLAITIATAISEQRFLSRTLGKTAPRELKSTDMGKSYCPLYMDPPEGSRTVLSSCLGIGLTYRTDFYRRLIDEFRIRDNEKNNIWDRLVAAAEPVTLNGDILAYPHIIVGHTTRYKPEILTGITRILGTGSSKKVKFGEFSTVTIEEARKELLEECKLDREYFEPEEIALDYSALNIRYACVLREFPKTTPGRRSPRSNTSIVSLERDLGLDLKKITGEARERYKI